MLRYVCLLAALATGNAASTAFANESRYTDFSMEQGQCKPTDPAMDPNADAEGGSVSVLCPGFGKYQVLYKEGDLRASVHYGYLSKDVIDNFWESFAPFNSVGPKIEWRLDDSGVPRAAIQRFVIADPEGDASTSKGAQVLVISKVGQPGDKTGCVVGMVDAFANKNANELARQVADDVAPGFTCKQDAAEYHGERGDKAADLGASFGE